MTNFNEWEYLLISINTFVDVELYYMLVKEDKDEGITVKIKENVDGWEAEIGRYSTLKESMAAVEEYKEKVEKLVKLEQDLF